MDLFSFLSFHFMCVTMTVVTGHSVALSRCSHLFSMMSFLHDVLVHDKGELGGYEVLGFFRVPKIGNILQNSLFHHAKKLFFEKIIF
jgi:hypothetical protein